MKFLKNVNTIMNVSTNERRAFPVINNKIPKQTKQTQKNSAKCVN